MLPNTVNKTYQPNNVQRVIDIINYIQMRNPKKTQVERIASVQFKKTVSVIKCFICNQMFYSQNNFDDHMKLHSSKLSRNLPQQIQRKTMESFRVKKNQGLNSSKQVGVISKKILNQTATVIRPKAQQEKDSKKQQQLEYNQSRKQIQQAEDALRQSKLLIQKIEQFTQPVGNQNKDEEKSRSPQKIGQPTARQSQQISQQQFLKQFLEGNKITNKMFKIEQVLRVKFINSYLQSHQQQLIYLQNMESYLNNEQNSSKANIQKINEMKTAILSTMQSYVRENAVVMGGSKQEISHHSQLYITNTSQVKPTQEKPKAKQYKQQDFQIVENRQVAYCCQCYMQIQYGQDCCQIIEEGGTRRKGESIKDIIQQEQNQKRQTEQNKYHIECWQQKFMREEKQAKD